MRHAVGYEEVVQYTDKGKKWTGIRGEDSVAWGQPAMHAQIGRASHIGLFSLSPVIFFSFLPSDDLFQLSVAAEAITAE
jgi:hypothetical protein